MSAVAGPKAAKEDESDVRSPIFCKCRNRYCAVDVDLSVHSKVPGMSRQRTGEITP